MEREGKVRETKAEKSIIGAKSQRREEKRRIASRSHMVGEGGKLDLIRHLLR